MTTAFLFPGQGSQSVGMMAAYGELAGIRSIFDEASAALGEDLWAMSADGPADVINLTRNTQPLMLAADIAVWNAWQSLGGAVPAFVAGHSLGEFAALVAANSISLADAVRLVRLRADAMQEAEPNGAMAAILGMDDAAVVALCVDEAKGDVLEAVNFNSPGQVVIAGKKAAVERAVAAAKGRGAKRALPLPVSVPSHCALMKPAAERLASALAEIDIQPPAIPVLHNVDGVAHADPGEIRQALAAQLYRPVLWTRTVENLADAGVDILFECGPGKVLAGLVKRIVPNVAVVALADEASLRAAAAG